MGTPRGTLQLTVWATSLGVSSSLSPSGRGQSWQLCMARVPSPCSLHLPCDHPQLRPCRWPVWMSNPRRRCWLKVLEHSGCRADIVSLGNFRNVFLWRLW